MKPHLFLGGILIFIVGCASPVTKPADKPLKIHVVRFGVGLDLPSRDWGPLELGYDFHGVNAVNDSTSIYVEQLPGAADIFMQNVLKDLPEGSKISRETITSFAQFKGSGTHVMIAYPDRKKDNTECVLFYPKGELEGYYIAMRMNEPSVALNQTTAGGIIASIRKEQIKPTPLSKLFGTWSTFVFDAKPYGDAIVIYEFRADGNYRALIIPIQIGTDRPDKKPGSSNPFPSFAVHGTFRVKGQQLTIAEENIPSPKTLTFSIDVDILTVAGPDFGDPLIMMRTQSAGGP
jgi:hypothetical protein